ncbi:MAG: hypothetical protein JJE39_05240 [Vicinamibacteria bacterium]|nr:hypothetical protein [Vicinamibacteria bacterium]
MRSVSWPRALALTSFLALVGYFGFGVPDQRAPVPAGGAAMNREIERRLDLAVNGSAEAETRAIRPPVSRSWLGASAPIPPPSSGLSPGVATQLGLLVLGGFVLAIRRAILVFARMRRLARAGQTARYPTVRRVEGTVARPS